MGLARRYRPTVQYPLTEWHHHATTPPTTSPATLPFTIRATFPKIENAEN